MCARSHVYVCCIHNNIPSVIRCPGGGWEEGGRGFHVLFAPLWSLFGGYGR